MAFPDRQLTKCKRSVDITKQSPSLIKVSLSPTFTPFADRGSAQPAEAVHSYLSLRIRGGFPRSPPHLACDTQSAVASSLEDSTSGIKRCPALGQVWSFQPTSEGTGAVASGVAKSTHIPLFWRYPWALTPPSPPRLHCLLLLFCSRGNLSFRGWLLVFFSLPPQVPL